MTTKSVVTGRTPSTLASWPATIIRALDEQGVDGRRLAVEAGIDPATLEDPEARVPSLAVMRLFQLAIDATGDPAFGLSVAKFVRQTTFYALGYAMLASRTLKEALERTIRYRRLIGDLLELRLEASPDRYRLLINFTGAPPFSDAVVDAAASIAVRAGRFLRGDRTFSPISVLLQRPPPQDVEPYRRVFRAPVAFGQPVNALEFRRSEIDACLPDANYRLAQQNDEVIVRYLTSLEPASVSSRVQRALLAALPSGAPTKRDVARRLGMSPRNLQRRLCAEGNSFKQLLREARVMLATGYIGEGRLSVKEIAFLLGFTGGSAFSRAFKHWTGRAPTDHPVFAGTRTPTRPTDNRRPKR